MQKFKKITLSSLLPNPKNPRKDLKPGDSEYAKIKISIEQFQFLDPIIFNTRTLKVIGGHQRLKILQEAGITDLFTVSIGAYSWAFSQNDLKELSPAMETAANIALNKVQGDWNSDQLVLNFEELKVDNFDLSLTGWDETEITQMESPKSKKKRVTFEANKKITCPFCKREFDKSEGVP
jgi:ParB-like chromosome segregation protein Spo0J